MFEDTGGFSEHHGCNSSGHNSSGQSDQPRTQPWTHHQCPRDHDGHQHFEQRGERHHPEPGRPCPAAHRLFRAHCHGDLPPPVLLSSPPMLALPHPAPKRLTKTKRPSAEMET